MLPMDKRYTVLVGNYGSGKTELAIAIARTQRAREPEGRIALVDLDIVNPYFRSAEQHALLEAEGIEVFMPSFAMSTVDIPALPAQIQDGVRYQRGGQPEGRAGRHRCGDRLFSAAGPAYQPGAVPDRDAFRGGTDRTGPGLLQKPFPHRRLLPPAGIQ